MRKYVKDLADYFKPGNVVYLSYWNSYDKVIKFTPSDPNLGGSWSVTVIECDKDGNVLPDAEERVHCTHPTV